MKRALFTFTILGAFLYLGGASATEHDCNWAPPNMLHLHKDANKSTNMTKEKFNAILDAIEKEYKGVIEEQGAKLVFDRRWTSNEVNARAGKMGKNWTVIAYGGLARYKTITEDAFALVMCHELGHLIAGKPYHPDTVNFPGKELANEGQSDHWSTLECAKKIWKEDPANVENASTYRLDITKEITNICNETYDNEDSRLICERSNAGGISMAKTLALLGREAKTPAFDTPDTTVVKKTNHEHPKAQCRLDTTHSGSINGERPLCWFAPDSEDDEAPVHLSSILR